MGCHFEVIRNCRWKARVSGIVAAAGVLALCLATLAPLTENDFVNFDDNVSITANPFVRRGLTAEGVRWSLTATRTGNWHPLTWLSHMVDVELFGLDPAGHHAVGLALHATNSLLLLLLLSRLTGALWPPALVAALFAVHPLHVESVAWASERKDLLATFFALLALLCWLRHLHRTSSGCYLSTCVLFALALMAKPMPVTLPFLLLLLDWWPLGRWTPGTIRPAGSLPPLLGVLPPVPLWIEKLPLFLLAAAAATVAYLAQAGAGAMEYGYRLPLVARAANVPSAYLGYLARAMWPANLSFFYPFPPEQPHPLKILAISLAIAFVTALLLRFRRECPWLGIGWLWYLGTLVPVIGLIQVGAQSMADRYTYLPLTGLFIAAAWAIRDAVSRRHGPMAPFAIACCALLVVLAGMAHTQAAVWRDSFSLARHALRTTQDNWLAHGQLATAAGAQGDLTTALRHYLESLAIVPRHAPTHNNLGSIYDHLGRGAEAMRHFRTAITLDPAYAPAHLNLGIFLAKAGSAREAEGALRRAIALDPDLAEAWNSLGSLLLAAGRVDEAIDAYRSATARDPEYADAHFNLGLSLLRGRDAEAAVASLREAERIQPGDIPTLMVLGDTLLGLGLADEAAQAYSRALMADPGLQAARDGIAKARAGAQHPFGSGPYPTTSPGD